MLRGVIIAAIMLLLSACDDMPSARSKSEIREIAAQAPRQDIAILQSQIVELKGEIAQLKSDNEFQAKWINRAVNGSAELERHVNANAKVANENALKDMTRRGACGTRRESIWNEDGSFAGSQTVKIECTLNDLKD